MVASILAGRHSRAAHHHSPSVQSKDFMSNDCLCISPQSSISPLPLHCAASWVLLDLDRSDKEGKNNLLVDVHSLPTIAAETCRTQSDSCSRSRQLDLVERGGARVVGPEVKEVVDLGGG